GHQAAGAHHPADARHQPALTCRSRDEQAASQQGGPVALFRPRPLPPGGHIRVISPGFPSLAHAPNRPKHAEQTLIKWGFKVSYGKHAFDISPEGDTAGTAPERAADFMEAFEDPSV